MNVDNTWRLTKARAFVGYVGCGRTTSSDDTELQGAEQIWRIIETYPGHKPAKKNLIITHTKNTVKIYVYLNKIASYIFSL